MIEIEGSWEDYFSPHKLWVDGIEAYHQGKGRGSCPLRHPRAILAFQRGWDKAAAVEKMYVEIGGEG